MGAGNGGSIEYCLTHSIVLTRRCGNRCAYCDFPNVSAQPLPSQKALARRLRRALNTGASNVEIVCGEGIDNSPETLSLMRFYGKRNFDDYLVSVFRGAARACAPESSLPTANIGNLSLYQLRRLKPYIGAVHILLENVCSSPYGSKAHYEAPDKRLDKRLQTILNAGQVGVPVTTGLLVGIGETARERQRGLRLIFEAHSRYGHIQNVVIERFHPRPNTPMEDWDSTSVSEMLDVIAEARRMFGPDFPITVKALENPDLAPGALEAGANDFGNVELLGASHADDDMLQRLALARSYCASRWLEMRERPPVFGTHLSERWLSESLLDAARARQPRKLESEVG